MKSFSDILGRERCLTLIDIVYNGMKGKFMSDDEFAELQHLLRKQSLLIEELELDLKKFS